jgi:hypothetical protein
MLGMGRTIIRTARLRREETTDMDMGRENTMDMCMERRNKITRREGRQDRMGP